MRSSKAVDPQPWQCVVETDQTWRDPAGKTHEVTAVVQGLINDRRDARVSLRRKDPPFSTETMTASRLCAGDSGWSRLPDEDEAETTFFAKPKSIFEQTIVGTPPSGGGTS